MIIEQPAKWLRWLYPRATWRMDKTEKAVYLTFDDGPIPESTPFILETLAAYDAHATFFMVGDNVRKYPELFKQIVAAGHQVGNHTFNHWGGFKHTTKSYSANTEKANQLIGAHLFRPPHGWMRWEQYFWLGRKYRIVMWDLVTRDYSKWLTAEDVLRNVKRYTRNGSIITFHDSLKSINKLRYALPEALKWMKEQGYEFKTFECAPKAPAPRSHRLQSESAHRDFCSAFSAGVPSGGAGCRIKCSPPHSIRPAAKFSAPERPGMPEDHPGHISPAECRSGPPARTPSASKSEFMEE